MELIQLLIFISLICFCSCNNITDENDKETKLAHGEQLLSDQIRLILKHYQQPDPIGLPNVPIPDPMTVPDLKHSFSMLTINLKSVTVHGLSKFRIIRAESEIALMQVLVALNIENIDIRGLYTLSNSFSSWLGESAGNFTVKLSGVDVQGVAKLEVASNGKLRAQDIDMDLTFEKIDMDFKNLGFLESVFQGAMNSLGSFIFDSIKPFILNEVNTNIRGEVNKKISKLPHYFPNSISPFDMAIAEARKQVSDLGYDPYKLKDYSQSAGLITVVSSHTWLTGLASFYRMGNITLTMENGTVHAVIDVGTQEIDGRTHWEVGLINGFLSRAGTISFTVQYLRMQMKLIQPVDTRKRASLEELNFELGNIQTRIHGAGTLDYIIEAGVNILPNLLRYQIMDAIEGPIKNRIQEEINKIDVEKLISENIPIVEKQVLIKGIKLSEAIILAEIVPALPEDENLKIVDSAESSFS
ncbi:uncharacterized protein LOC123259348 isoform X1 [Cotesia glomerata]|uniref:Uncharacterized protein n=2 Tax=Cotesia glomerata TaxID=32391 RepID=A0AAV7I399_COTGL|nr:uncharacterized protein LOC123259348 isoform X1 [Cotesia glomerata]KAH0540334.1 hypothetical protein KQX54_016421 [Cotesia glomerata]